MATPLIVTDANTGEEIDADKAIDQDIQFIKELINPTQNNPAKWCYDGRPEEKSFLFEVRVRFQGMKLIRRLQNCLI